MGNPLETDSAMERLIRMEEKLDNVLQHRLQTDIKVEAHDIRLRAVEQGQSRIWAMGISFASFVTLGGSVLEWFRH